MLVAALLALLPAAVAAPTAPSKPAPAAAAETAPACGTDALACYEAALARLAGPASPEATALAVLDHDAACEGGLVPACFAAVRLTKGVDLDALRAAWDAACKAGRAQACVRAVREGADEELRRALVAACDAGWGGACRQLGSWTMEGRGEARDPRDAIARFAQACSRGSGLACSRLATLHAEGLATSRDLDEAQKWADASCLPLARTGCRGDTLDPAAHAPLAARVADDATTLSRFRHEERVGVCRMAVEVDGRGNTLAWTPMDCDDGMVGSVSLAAKASRWDVPAGDGPFYAVLVYISRAL